MTSAAAPPLSDQLPPPGAVRAWLSAARPKTLVAAMAPVAVGTALAYHEGGARAGPALAALLGSVLIQIGTNLANDHYDFIKGADTAERVGPRRASQSGWISPRAVLAGAVVCFGLATLVGLYLVAVGGWPIAVLGTLSIVCGFAYTAGPFPLGYRGLGDLFVFLFFGLFAVVGTTYVQTGAATARAFAAAVPVGALATAILAVNNLRDLRTDALAGKRTLVVRLGEAGGRAEYLILLALALLAPALFPLMGWTGSWPMLATASLPLAIPPARRVLRGSGASLNPALGETARLLAAFSLLFSLGLWLDR